MANDLTFDHINHIFGDIGGMIGNALQMPGNAEQVDQTFDMFGMIQNALFDLIVHFLIHRIHFIIASADAVGQ